MGTPKDSEKTKARIIEAAGQLFAERGFKGVTVRDIAQKAETQISALNYHFRGKEALYREVLLEACGEASITPEDRKKLLNLKPEEALYIIITESIKDYRMQSASSWQTVVITKECWEPSAVFTEVVKEYYKPLTDFVAGIVGRIVGKPAEDQQVRFAVISLVGLLDTFGLYGHFVDAVAPGLTGHLNKKNLLAKQLFHMVIEAANTSIKG